MSLERLEKEGYLLPERARGEIPLESTVSKPAFLAVGALGLVSCIVAWWGNGGTWTWIGLGSFLLCLYLFLWITLRAIRRQNDRLEEVLEGAES